jgi:hypothetical protein
MRPEVCRLVQLGRFPPEHGASVLRIAEHQDALGAIEAPLSDAEARALVALFGSDNCYGLSWSLLHLIESSPNWPLWDALEDQTNEWVVRLRERSRDTQQGA